MHYTVFKLLIYGEAKFRTKCIRLLQWGRTEACCEWTSIHCVRWGKHNRSSVGYHSIRSMKVVHVYKVTVTFIYLGFLKLWAHCTV